MDNIGNLSIEEIEIELDHASPEEIDAIAQGDFAPLAVAKQPKTQLSKISKSDAAFGVVMFAASGVVVYCIGMLFSFAWLPFTVDKAAYDYAGDKSIPTRVTYCWDTDFGGRICTVRNNKDQFEKFVIREDR